MLAHHWLTSSPPPNEFGYNPTKNSTLYLDDKSTQTSRESVAYHSHIDEIDGAECIRKNLFDKGALAHLSSRGHRKAPSRYDLIN
ncbi:MAG: hypothetical protein SNG49_08880 [Rikenellaceae bacterium]